ncbi:MAG: hexokinase [Tannerella sp.]|jgi:hexokinase|nr:hexokinase [Tannerella sp.]
MTDIFNLSATQLREISEDLKQKILTGLSKDGTEIACLPTYINPGKDFEGKVLALDWGGTNFRASIIKFAKGAKPEVLDVRKRPLSATETKGFSQDNLHGAIADTISQLQGLDEQVKHIGYCFSYPAESTIDGDAVLLHWTKEIDIPDMPYKMVGKPLMEYLNTRLNTKIETVKVVNDTIACLFAGLMQPGYDSYIGLIVGTGTNMAGLISKDSIPKLNKEYRGGDFIPVNLESGNLKPTCRGREYLSPADEKLDAESNSKGRQIFEKGISGGYIGQLFRLAYPSIEIEKKFDGEKISNIINYPAIYKNEYVATARAIYTRSAQLVAASLAGLTQVAVDYKSEDDFNRSITNICLAADGSLFWSSDANGTDYNVLVTNYLEEILTNLGLGHIHFRINRLDDANLIGSAIAALS